MRLIPTRDQWKYWQLPSRLTAIGVVVGLVSIAITVVLSFRSGGCSVQQPVATTSGDVSPSINVPGDGNTITVGVTTQPQTNAKGASSGQGKPTQPNSPQLSFAFTKYSKLSYFRIEQLDDLSIRVSYYFTIRNIGSVTAKHIRVPRKVWMTRGKRNVVHALPHPGILSLGPGEGVRLDLGYTEHFESPEDMNDMISSLRKDTIQLQIPIEYESAADVSAVYKTTLGVKISLSDVTITHYDHE